jgi:hypothetical protein
MNDGGSAGLLQQSHPILFLGRKVPHEFLFKWWKSVPSGLDQPRIPVPSRPTGTTERSPALQCRNPLPISRSPAGTTDSPYPSGYTSPFGVNPPLSFPRMSLKAGVFSARNKLPENRDKPTPNLLGW